MKTIDQLRTAAAIAQQARDQAQHRAQQAQQAADMAASAFLLALRAYEIAQVREEVECSEQDARDYLNQFGNPKTAIERLRVDLGCYDIH